MQSISRTRGIKQSAELCERILAAEGMPAEFPNDEPVSFVALDEVVAAEPEETDGDAADDGAPRLCAGDDLTSVDRPWWIGSRPPAGLQRRRRSMRTRIR